MDIFNFDKHWDLFLQTKLVINCQTREDARAFISLICKVENSLNEHHNIDCMTNWWNTYKDKTCYSFAYNKRLNYCDLNFYKENKYQIVRFDKEQSKIYLGVQLDDRLNVNPYTGDIGFGIPEIENTEKDKTYYISIAKFFNLELEERFKLIFTNPITNKQTLSDIDYYFTSKGLCYMGSTGLEFLEPFNTLHEILLKNITIQKLPWIPKYKETYYIPSITDINLYREYTHTSHVFDERMIERGIPCKTPEEAIEKTKEMLKLL